MSEQDPVLVSVEKVEPTANTTVESQQQENTTVPSETTPSTSNSHEITTTTNTVDSVSENSTEATEKYVLFLCQFRMKCTLQQLFFLLV